MTAFPQADGTFANGASLEKVMTLSQSEYAKSIGAFAGDVAAAIALRGDPVSLPLGTGQVVITFEKIEGFSFGGLLEMPRARVIIRMYDVEPAEAAAFMRRFDISFQRGGG